MATASEFLRFTAAGLYLRGIPRWGAFGNRLLLASPLTLGLVSCDGLPSAIAQARAFARSRDVTLTAGNLTGQAIAAGLVDELSVSLVPVVFGSGVRFFGD